MVLVPHRKEDTMTISDPTQKRENIRRWITELVEKHGAEVRGENFLFENEEQADQFAEDLHALGFRTDAIIDGTMYYVMISGIVVCDKYVTMADHCES